MSALTEIKGQKGDLFNIRRDKNMDGEFKQIGLEILNVMEVKQAMIVIERGRGQQVKLVSL